MKNFTIESAWNSKVINEFSAATDSSKSAETICQRFEGLLCEIQFEMGSWFIPLSLNGHACDSVLAMRFAKKCLRLEVF